MVAITGKWSEYFTLSTQKGLEVYIWQMAAKSYTCVVVSGRNLASEWQELIKANPLTMEQAQLLVSYYLENGLQPAEVAVVPTVMYHSSYYYECNEAYQENVRKLFWRFLETES